ncbi:universal stress protein [Leptolyngbya sp. AN03gr2]|uniref:universal stress protein n=1 Tax=unclassified Leptolyngbya TaxID=2650499 RepID=UPI003D318631
MNWLEKKAVLVPIYFSEAAFAAVVPARSFVHSANQLHLLHVLPPLHPTDPAVVWNTVSDTSREHQVEVALRDRLKELGYEAANVTVVIGNPVNAILQYAQEHGIDLIVVPAKDEEEGVLSHFLFGSLAEQLVRSASCPVLVIR